MFVSQAFDSVPRRLSVAFTSYLTDKVSTPVEAGTNGEIILTSSLVTGEGGTLRIKQVGVRGLQGYFGFPKVTAAEATARR